MRRTNNFRHTAPAAPTRWPDSYYSGGLQMPSSSLVDLWLSVSHLKEMTTFPSYKSTTLPLRLGIEGIQPLDTEVTA